LIFLSIFLQVSLSKFFHFSSKKFLKKLIQEFFITKQQKSYQKRKKLSEFDRTKRIYRAPVN